MQRIRGMKSSNTTRKKGQSGRAGLVQCVHCGKTVPRDKAIEKRKSIMPLDRRLVELFKKKGAHLTSGRKIVCYSVSCAKHCRYV